MAPDELLTWHDVMLTGGGRWQVNLMTLARALIPLFERMDDVDESLNKLQAIVSGMPHRPP